SVDHIFDRFPMLFVKMRKGVFWNYFDTNVEKFLVMEEKNFPCDNINQIENNGYFLKLLCFGKRISVEIFHSLTDGCGAIEFLKMILHYYFNFLDKTKGNSSTNMLIDKDILDVLPEEMEDSFSHYYKDTTLPQKKCENSYCIKGTSFESYGNNVTTGVLSASELNSLAKSKSATITSYLASVLIYSIYKTQQRYEIDTKPIIVSIPVNLRKVFPSRTLRNFFGVVNVGMAVNRTTTLEEIIEKTTKQLKTKTSRNALQDVISNNVKLEKNLYSRLTPLFIKKMLISLGFNLLGETKKTITISNIGNISIPEEMKTLVKQIEVVLYPTLKSPINCGICSVNDRLTISFSRSIVESDIIRSFFNILSENNNLNISLYSNDWGQCNE
ncbi:MAG: alcohol acetyltransferase, partial [Oscillospiraceae bacterium]